MSFLITMFCGLVAYCTTLVIIAKKRNAEQAEESRKSEIISTIMTDLNRFSDPNDYYKVLSVPPFATQSDITSAYQQRLQLYNVHIFGEVFNNDPDVLANLAKLIIFLNNAYTALTSNPTHITSANKTPHNANKIYANPDTLLESLIETCITELDGYVDDFDPNDKASYWSPEELNN